VGDEAKPADGRRDELAQRLLPYVLVLLMPFGIGLAPRLFNDGDVSWHVAVGRWIWAHRAIPSVDPFSFTMAGKPWVAMEWPADLVMAGAYGLAGFAGLAAVVTAALVALHLIVFAYLRTRASPIAIVVTLIVMDVVLAPFMLARPHVLVWPVVAGWTALLARSTETGRPPPLWAALLLVAWTNLHGSFPLAAVIAAPLAFDALVAAEWKTLRAWLLFAGVSAVAICLNLNGLDGLLQPFRVAQLESLTLIQEWLPSTPHSQPQFYAALLLGLGLLLWRGVRVPPGRLVLVLVLLALAFTQVRHQSWFAIVAVLLVPPLFAGNAEPGRKLLPLALLAVPLVLLRGLIPLAPAENVANPRSLIAAIPPALRDQPVFNEYSFGGPLILAGIRPYIDGRSELYGDAFMTDYVRILGGDMARFDRAVARYDIRWAMLPAKSDLGAALEKSGGWKRTYADRVGAIYVRDARSTISERKAL